ncbi:DUF6864 domain-containing function [Pyramidobacter piscolens]|uniref:DUF6864 domain-containing function n=1 Tax=Pyramidobacter piscolens TaxID=638849 RepID=UPI0024938ED2|nr:hypothetical protein [Pyramidobacter piscolens]
MSEERADIQPSKEKTSSISTDQAEIQIVFPSGKRVIANTHFFTEDLGKTGIILTYKDFQYAITLTFIEGDEDRVNIVNINEHSIALVFKRFDSSVGVYVPNLYQIGEIAGEKLFIRARIARPYKDANFREISMTFYVEG